MGSDNGPASANEEEAQRAKALGREALQRGDYERAVRMLRISERLVPNPDTRGLLNAALAGQARAQAPQRQAQQQEAAAQGPRWSENDIFGRFMNNRVDVALDAVYRDWLPPAAKRLIERYIHPASRRPLAYVLLAIVVVAVYRFVLHGPRLAFGRLPGDVYYTNPNQTVVVSAPIISCIVFSVGLNILGRLFRGY